MGFFGELVIWCSSAAVLGTVMGVVIGKYRVKAAMELKASEDIPRGDDAEKSVRYITGIICRRMHALGFPAIYSDRMHDFAMLDTFGICDSKDLKTFFQMANAVGLEVVVRPRKENRKGGGETVMGEYVLSMREEWYAHEKKTWLDPIINWLDSWLSKNK